MSWGSEEAPDTQPTVVDLTGDEPTSPSFNPESTASSLAKGLGLVGAALLILVIGLVFFDGGSRKEEATPPPTVDRLEPPDGPTPIPAIETARGAMGFSDILALVREARESGVMPEAYTSEAPPTVSPLTGGVSLCGELHLEPGGIFEGALWFEIGEGGSVTTWAGRPRPDRTLAEDLLDTWVGGQGLARAGDGLIVRPYDMPSVGLVYWQLDAEISPVAGAGPRARFLAASGDLVAFEEAGELLVVDVAQDRVVGVYVPAAPRSEIQTAVFNPSANRIAVLDNFAIVSTVDLRTMEVVHSTPTRAASVVWTSENEIGVVRAVPSSFVLASVNINDSSEVETHRLIDGVPWHLSGIGNSC
ncbi:MAG: hypothetical protein ACR2PK_14155 [Acidimicrobiales bacterium]